MQSSGGWQRDKASSKALHEVKHQQVMDVLANRLRSLQALGTQRVLRLKRAARSILYEHEAARRISCSIEEEDAEAVDLTLHW